jgi:tryptophanyl-tRNA synthetase
LFPVPETQLVQSITVPGIDGKKMRSGSRNDIKLFERFDVLQDKVARIRTDSRGSREPKDPDTCTVFAYFSMIAAKDDAERMRARYLEGSIGYEEAKRELTRAIFERFGPFQGRYRHWKRNKNAVLDVLEDGARAAAREFAETLDGVFSILKLRDRVPVAGWEE